MAKVSKAVVATVTNMGQGEWTDAGSASANRDAAESDAFVEAFDTLAQAIRRARGAGSSDGGGRPRLSFSQYALVRALSEREVARVGDLAQDAAVRPSTASRILDALERRGLVRRDRGEDDRRAVTVALTPEGRSILHRQDAWMQGRERAFYAALPEEERALAPDLLVRLAALIDELATGPGDPV